MKILLFTQKIDRTDSVLGFMHGWITEFSKHFEKITAVGLFVGEHDLPKNVSVFSLGKGNSGNFQFSIFNFQIFRRLKYSIKFYRYIWKERKNYDAVFVHMNEEYVFLGGLIWKILGKKVYMWRNHYYGTWWTDLASSFCNKVFCTSKSSYTAKYKQTVLMPVGVSTDFFKPIDGILRESHSVLFLARMALSKRPDLLLEASGELLKRNVDFSVHFYGGPKLGDEKYYEDLKKRVSLLNLGSRVQFLPATAFAKGPEIYSSHEIFVNLSPAGMFDKTLFEASGCGCLVLATSPDFAEIVGDERFNITDVGRTAIADKLEMVLGLPESEKKLFSEKFRQIAVGQSLDKLALKLLKEMSE